MIPKAQYLDVLSRQICLAPFIVLHLLRHAMLKTVQLDLQPRGRAIEIQSVNPQRMLATEFESGETVASQRAPKLFFLVGLVAA